MVLKVKYVWIFVQIILKGISIHHHAYSKDLFNLRTQRTHQLLNFSINFWRFKTWDSVTKNFTCPKNIELCTYMNISCSYIFCMYLAMHSNVYEVWAFRWVTMFACHCTRAVKQHAFLLSYICFSWGWNHLKILWRKYTLTHIHIWTNAKLFNVLYFLIRGFIYFDIEVCNCLDQTT